MSTPTRKKRRPQRRDEILDAALGLFFERGYQATSLDDVAGALGMAGPSLYRHFGSKLDILDACVHRGGEYVMGEVDKVASAGGPPEAMLEALARDLTAAVLREPRLVTVAMRERHHLPAESCAWFERSYRLMTEEWVHVLLQLRPELSDDDARFTVRLVLSMIYSTADHMPDRPTAETADRIVAMALAALLGG